MTLADRINRAARTLPTWPLYIAAVIYPAVLLWQALQGQLGPDPVAVLEHTIGLRGLQVLMASLAITPLRRFAGVNLIRFRRALGLIARRIGISSCRAEGERPWQASNETGPTGFYSQ